jgi:hypothetical protein
MNCKVHHECERSQEQKSQVFLYLTAAGSGWLISGHVHHSFMQSLAVNAHVWWLDLPGLALISVAGLGILWPGIKALWHSSNTQMAVDMEEHKGQGHPAVRDPSTWS